MRFILYLLSCLNELFGVVVGLGTDNASEQNKVWIGLAVLACIILIWFIVDFILAKCNLKGVKIVIFSILITIGVILLFCAICVLIEYSLG